MSGLALLEITGYTPAMVALDAMEKAAQVRVVQMELNDFYGVFLKVAGDSSSLRAAVAAAQETIAALHGKCNATVIDAPSAEARRAIHSPPERSPLLEVPIVFDPIYSQPAAAAQSGKSAAVSSSTATQSRKENPMSDSRPFAIGLIETQGFTAVMEAIDTACKAANVTIAGKEKLGGGYITIVIKGDVAAVQAAIDAGKAKVEGLGKLIAAHVIPRPSEGVLALLPKA